MSVAALFWFDVEDYLTPQSDDALKGLLEIFEDVGVQGTWKVVAEKARALEHRGRSDVIRLLQRQDIGYHTDNHSQHPVLAEYLRDAGWDDGVEEVIRRERPGYEDLVRILGPASTFGQAGGSWAPQLYPFLRDAGIPLFMDEAGHIGCDGEPFWYCGVLHVNRLGDNCTRTDFDRGEAGLAEGKRRFDEICERRLGEGGGPISIYYHPCEWATTAFWDVTFARGAMPPPEEWQPAPLRPPGQMEQGLAVFRAYLEHVSGRPDVEILTGRQLLNQYPDPALHRAYSAAEIASIIEFDDGGVDTAWLGETALAPAELFALVVDLLLETFLALSDGADLAGDIGHRIDSTVESTPYGPVRRPPAEVPAGEVLGADRFLEAAADARQSLHYHGRLPDSVWIGARRLALADFLVTASDLLRRMIDGACVPTEIRVREGCLLGERHVRDDAWDWVVFPEGFTAPAICEHARLQAWTLKPAVSL